jgi:hypothetical protein
MIWLISDKPGGVYATCTLVFGLLLLILAPARRTLQG